MNYKWKIDSTLKKKLIQLGCEIKGDNIIPSPKLLFNIIEVKSSSYEYQGTITKTTGNKKPKVMIRIPYNSDALVSYTIYK